jgi:hypothetical protein
MTYAANVHGNQLMTFCSAPAAGSLVWGLEPLPAPRARLYQPIEPPVPSPQTANRVYPIPGLIRGARTDSGSRIIRRLSDSARHSLWRTPVRVFHVALRRGHAGGAIGLKLFRRRTAPGVPPPPAERRR